VNPKSHKLVLDFIPKNKGQIKKKAAALGVDWQDYSQEIALFILERSEHFDARLGSFTAFVFGHVDKRLNRQKNDALYRAQSIDGDCCQSISARHAVESLTAEDAGSEDSAVGQIVRNMAPGATTLLAVADVISGLSAQDVARKCKRTKRRVNQILHKMRDEAKTQFALDLGYGGE
jgi:DNA-directed RNA polymerase specialized sigma24 family protein